MKFKLIAAMTLLASIGTASAGVIVIDPASDGSLYTCAGCNTVQNGDLIASGYIQGIVKFSSAGIDGPVESALLSVNPLALPLWGPIVDVYGFGTELGALDASDAFAGTFLGSWTLPELALGEDAFFDVTSFVAGTTASFLAFNLRTAPGGTDVFSSLEQNYGHPAQLTVTTAARAVPEPSTLVLFAAGILGFGLIPRRRRAKLG